MRLGCDRAERKERVKEFVNNHSLQLSSGGALNRVEPFAMPIGIFCAKQSVACLKKCAQPKATYEIPSLC